ncbi:uncharacterized protein TRAVEDRAFT_166210 [Trametes versicolor FP-101664 SS1]|uniref:uncharacterized protein n=1 Tax=Trametes versicolor (strain FP-101664) TaxID=717944 RepID=UPI000462301C|nr:uncharacterized protein TRAVEDRAFT_166210 [Trametes versicolor FP-101664 SS1]EIW61073.1 hypothetical protein TRAVEDRAFT_166210 [Trametes versicolor FP-101664 SS1]
METDIYDQAGGELKLPELQFIDVLIARKVAALKALDLGTLPRSDYIMYLSLPYIPVPGNRGGDRYWRRVRVSGGLPLAVFADKIITPLFGWVRNSHAHLFTDFKDGALFGPRNCNTVDMRTHLNKSGRAFIPEEEYRISHILQHAGDVMGYHYDLGDNWWVDIKLEEVIPAVDSTNAFELISGAGGALPEDGAEHFGNICWAHFLRSAAACLSGKIKAVNRIFTATNHAGKPRPARPADYDFDHFDFPGTRAAVRAALDSKASLSWGSKTAVHPLGKTKGRDLVRKEHQAMRLGIHPNDLKKGTKVRHTRANTKGAFIEEGVANRRVDNPKNTTCAWCGNPHDLKICTGCRQRYYCKKACHSVRCSTTHVQRSSLSRTQAHGRRGHRDVCR